MPSPLLELYLFLTSPATQTLSAINQISIPHIHNELTIQPNMRILVRVYRVNRQSELFSPLTSPQAYKNYNFFLHQLKRHLANASIFESLLTIMMSDLIVSDDITHVFDAIIEQWKITCPEPPIVYLQQPTIKQWYLEELPTGSDKANELIDGYYQTIKTTLDTVKNPNGLNAVVIESLLQNPFQGFAYIKWMIKDQKSSPEDLVNSELFHWFLLQHIDRLDIEKDVFQHFFHLVENAAKKSNPFSPNYSDLFILLKNTNTHCIQQLPRNLRGEVIKTDIPEYKKLEKPTVLKTPNHYNLNKYIELFGLSFVVKALTIKNYWVNSELDELIERLNTLSDKDIIHCLNIGTSDENEEKLTSKITPKTFARLFFTRQWLVLNFVSPHNIQGFHLYSTEEQASLLNDLEKVSLNLKAITGLQKLYLHLTEKKPMFKSIVFKIMLQPTFRTDFHE